MSPNQMIYDSNIHSRMYYALSDDTQHEFRTFKVYGFVSYTVKNALNRT